MRIFRKSKRSKAILSFGKRRVYFVSHEATRTGAPKIILNLLKQFSKKCDIQCESLLITGGHLATDFQNFSITDCFNTQLDNQDEIKKRVARSIAREKNNPPVLAICNSMESRYVAQELFNHGVPCVSLVHELPSSYSEKDYQSIFESSQKVVFPAHTVRDAADAKTQLPPGRSLVLPQGLLDSEFGSGMEREMARKAIRQELGIPENAFIVLGCGTLDLRKGIDHFGAIARESLSKSTQDRPIHFVWVGEGPRWTHSIHHYVELDLKKTRTSSHVHFIGGRENVEPYFLGSDCFLMCSRVDPFPCVINEAMACEVPIIAFANSGGAPEAIDNGAGYIIPYADYKQASSVISMLIDEPDVRLGVVERAKQRVLTRYCFKEYSDQIIELGEQIIGQSLRIPDLENSNGNSETIPFRKVA
ncbi:MAG: glycosyltransferase family 4 protein [Planctomycetota bacterium]